MTDLFTGWDLSKGISYQEKLQKVAELLNDKEASAITFTAIETDGTLSQYVLGTIEGNTKFLLGFVNPGFHVAPYHYMVVDPNLAEPEAKLIYKVRGHPAIPGLWERNNQVPFEEGDMEDGKPHPKAFIVPYKDPTFVSVVDGRKYYANPEKQTLEDADTGNIFAWSLISSSYVSSQDPNLREKMNLFVPGTFDARMEKSLEKVAPGAVQYWSTAYQGDDWDSNVYDFVRSSFPKPGSVLKKGDLFAVMTTRDVLFFKEDGSKEFISAWGEQFSNLDLTTEGYVLPGAILNFAKSFLNIKMESFN